MLENSLYIIVAYLIGAVPFGYIAGKLRGLDLREHGSCNIGATNAIRVLGKAWGIPVFLLDFLKGFVPLLLMRMHLGGDLLNFDMAEMGWLLGVLFALVLGHTFTCYLQFKGGKGVATTAGCLFALSPLIGGSALGVWILCMLLTRYVSLSSMLAGVAMVVSVSCQLIIPDGQMQSSDILLIVAIGLICLLVIIKHRTNIVRLLQGTEPKAFSKKESVK